jgi:hypothetical protein
VTENPQTPDDASDSPADAGKPKPGIWYKNPIIIAGLIVVVVIVSVLVFPAILSMYQGGNCYCIKVISTTAQQTDNETIVATYHGGQYADVVYGITVTVTDSNGRIQSMTMGNKTRTECNWNWDAYNLPFFHAWAENYCSSPPLLPVGTEVSFKGDFSGKDHVLALAHYSDGEDIPCIDMTL